PPKPLRVGVSTAGPPSPSSGDVSVRLPRVTIAGRPVHRPRTKHRTWLHSSLARARLQRWSEPRSAQPTQLLFNFVKIAFDLFALRNVAINFNHRAVTEQLLSAFYNDFPATLADMPQLA